MRDESFFSTLVCHTNQTNQQPTMPLTATIDTDTGDVRIINNNSNSAAGSTKPAAAHFFSNSRS